MLRAAQAGLALALAACGGASPGPSRSAPEPSPASIAEPAPRQPTADARVLPRAATFGDVVGALQRLDQAPTAPGQPRCLLRLGAGESARLEAEPAVAVRPAPAAPADLDVLLQTEPGPVRILSRWGQHGTGVHSLALTALTASVPTHAAVAVLVTDEGVYVRTTVGEAARPLPFVVSELPEVLAALAPAAGSWTAFVTAESQVPLSLVAQVLQALPYPRAEVALAVPLTPGTRLPSAPAAPAEANRCPDGLPETDEPEGELSVAALRAGLQSMVDGAGECLRTTQGAGAAGSRLRVAFRVAADGSTAAACLSADEPRDDTLGRCVLNLARGMRFTAPAPSGSVDAELPLALKPDQGLRQAPLCGG